MKVGEFNLKYRAFLCAICLSTILAQAQQKRYVVIVQDAMGPAGTDMNSMLVFLQSPSVEVLGITVVTGDGWRNEEVAHTLRLLETVGRTDIPVVPGAGAPMIRTKQWTSIWEQMYGKVLYQGAWTMPRSAHGSDEIPKLPEGSPTTKPATEDAAHFLIRMVHKYPHQVTIYAAGPMTNIATAVIDDPEFAPLAQELVIMGGSVIRIRMTPSISTARAMNLICGSIRKPPAQNSLPGGSSEVWSSQAQVGKCSRGAGVIADAALVNA